MMNKEYEILKSVLRYVPDTGLLYWTKDISYQAKKNQEAGTLKTDGYRKLTYKRVQYQSHRVAFYIFYGYLPKDVDHISGDRLDNRALNLRGCDHRQNSFNSKISKNNKLGVKGVYLCKDSGRYKANIGVNGKTIPLGRFDDIRHAAHAYNKAAVKYFGEFACLNPI